MLIAMTGATGFIGSHLVDRLLADGHDLITLVRNETDPSPLETRGVRVVRGDVRDPVAVERALAGATLVYHLARVKGHVAQPMSEVHAVNVDGAANVARAAVRAGVERLVHCSSAAVYGRRERPRALAEDAPLDADSQYARSKMLAEEVVRANAGTHLPVTVARITTTLGPRCSSWLRFFRSIASRRLRVIGSGGNWHHPGDVSDIVDGLVRCGQCSGAEGRTYNLAGMTPLRMRELMQLTAHALGVGNGRQNRLPAFPFDAYLTLNDLTERALHIRLPRVESLVFLMGSRVLDISRARVELGYEPKVSAGDAICRTADWYRSEGLL